MIFNFVWIIYKFIYEWVWIKKLVHWNWFLICNKAIGTHPSGTPRPKVWQMPSFGWCDSEQWHAKLIFRPKLADCFLKNLILIFQIINSTFNGSFRLNILYIFKKIRINEISKNKRNFQILVDYFSFLQNENFKK